MKEEKQIIKYFDLILKLSSNIILYYKKLRKVDDLFQLKQFRGLKYEQLKGNLKGYSSIRLNGKYRLIFREVNSIEK